VWRAAYAESLANQSDGRAIGFILTSRVVVPVGDSGSGTGSKCCCASSPISVRGCRAGIRTPTLGSIPLPIARGMAVSSDAWEYDGGMRTFTAVVERDVDTGLYVGWVPGFRGAHSQGETLEELRANLREVVEMLLEDGTLELASEFVGTQTVEVA